MGKVRILIRDNAIINENDKLYFNALLIFIKLVNRLVDKIFNLIFLLPFFLIVHQIYKSIGLITKPARL